MKITIENTTRLVQINGVDARLWEGETDDGVPVHVFVTRLSPQSPTDSPTLESFKEQLNETRAPSAFYPLRMIL